MYMRKVIYVLSHGLEWKVNCDHCASRVMKTQGEAIKLARAHIASLPEGSLAQILVQGDGGRFRAEWTYGEDPFPPRG